VGDRATELGKVAKRVPIAHFVANLLLMSPPLFSPGLATDPAYVNLRTGETEWLVAARARVESMWAQFYTFADPNFLTEIRRDFQARFWEMYLTCTLLEHAKSRGYQVSCPKPGPDILLEFQASRIWIEALTATNGTPGLPDTLGPKGDSTNPEERIVLRYTNAIQEKYRKYLRYLRDGRVGKNDAYVVAINAANLLYKWIHAQDDAPPFVKAVYPLGYYQLLLDRVSGDIVGHQNETRSEITKASGKTVPVHAFMDRRWRGISGILCSFASPTYTGHLGLDFELAYNPMGRTPLPPDLITAKRVWTADLNDAGGNLVGRTLIP
jgi:hypothetical protein